MKNRVIAALLACGIVSGPVSAVSLHAEDRTAGYVLGDINGDSVVNTYDLALFRKYINDSTDFGIDYETRMDAKDILRQLREGDINDDGKADETDLGFLSDFLLGKPTSFGKEIGSIRLGENINIEAAEGKEADDQFRSSQMYFGLELFKRTAAPKEDENTGNVMVSPLSVITALSMTANGADGETLSEMERVLGGNINIDELNEYLANYIHRVTTDKNVNISVADSLWLINGMEKGIQQTFLETNKKYYDADLYVSPFDQSTLNDINTWVNKNTKGMIPKLYDKQSDIDGLVMCLINTLYFNADWADPYLSSHDDDFTNIKGEKVKAEMMTSSETTYYKGANYKGFAKPYKNHDYSFVGLLPDEGEDFDEFVAGLDPDEVRKTLANAERPDNDNRFKLIVTMPAFKYEYSTKLRDVLRSMGMEKAFDPSADFSRMTDPAKGFAFFIDNVTHKTAIEVNKKGTTAAAVTSVEMKNSMSVSDKEYKLDFNRPYVYMILDNKTELPLFIGTVTDISK